MPENKNSFFPERFTRITSPLHRIFLLCHCFNGDTGDDAALYQPKEFVDSCLPASPMTEYFLSNLSVQAG